MNIIKYVNTFGDKPLTEASMTLADVFVLTQLSYTEFSNVSENFDKKENLKNIASVILNLSAREKNSDRRQLLEAVYKSARFSDICLCGFVNESKNGDPAYQFSAITFEISKKIRFVVYRGTDSTLAGWKEDFQFSYLDKTPAQDRAKKYLADAMTTFDGDFYVSGHSKGGNLAAYATIYSDRNIRSRIKWLYLLDSPGFNEKHHILRQEGYIDLSDRMTCVLPRCSVFGRIFQIFPKKHCSVIYSYRDDDPFFLIQHDIFTWKLKNDSSPCYAKRLSEKSDKIADYINTVIESVGFEERRKVVITLFDILAECNIQFF